MTTQQLPIRHVRAAEGPSPVASVLVCLAIMAGGLIGAQHWLTAQCPVTPGLATVCTAAAPLL